MADHPASSPLSSVDPVLRAEFDRMMDGFAYGKDETVEDTKASRDRRNAEQGVRVAKVAALAAPSVPQSTPVVAPAEAEEASGPVLILPKELPRRLHAKPMAAPKVVPDWKVRLKRLALNSLCLNVNEAREEYPHLPPNMLSHVMC